MKLAFAIKQLDGAVGGAERVLCTVCSALAARGHEITIVSADRPGGAAFYPLDARVRRLSLGIGEASRSARPGETLRRMVALRKAMTRDRPDVLVAFMHSMFVPAALAMAGTGVPVVGSEHIVPEHYRGRPLQWALLNLSSPLLARLTVLSESARRSYPRWIRRRMTIVPNPVDTPRPGATDGQTERGLIVLNVARLDPQKDQATLIRAFAALADAHPDWRLRIVGEGALRGDLTDLIDRMQLADRVALVGVVRDIESEYRRAAIFALPSRYESFGLATAEAMSHGLPVVGFADCPGTNELVVDGVTGILVPVGAPREAGFARALEQLIVEPRRRAEFGRAGRERSSGLYGVDAVCDQWERMLGWIRE